MRISDQHLNHWREHGYVVVDPFLTREELVAAQQGLGASFPLPAAYAAAPHLYRTDERGGCMRELPYLGDALNLMALHPDIMSFVERALDTRRILLVQSLLWAKYPRVDDFEQPLHADYMNTTILYPASNGPRDEVTFILYYQDIDDQLGPTYVVSKRHSQGRQLVPHIRPRSEYPELYLHERPVYARAGSLLIYHMGTLHRGSTILSQHQARFSHHFVYRACDASAVGYRAWANYGLAAEMQHLIERASPRQREALGFPVPQDPYWSEETLAGIAARYPLMDMTPYVNQAALTPSRKETLRDALRQARAPESSVTRGADDMRARVAEMAMTGLQAWAYHSQLANYCASVTGIPANYWLPWVSRWTNANKQ